MIYYFVVDLDCPNPHIFDSYKLTNVPAIHNGVRTYIQNYINNNNYEPISMYESKLPDRTQLVTWFKLNPIRDTSVPVYYKNVSQENLLYDISSRHRDDRN